MNTNSQDMMDKINQERLKEYERIRELIIRFRSIATTAEIYAKELEHDQAYRYGLFPIEDLGPARPENDCDYRKPDGCDGCPLLNFADPD